MTTRVRRALLSVSDKEGIVELARALRVCGVEILSTGGTATLLARSGIEIVEVATHTGFPEIMDGRVKTLHPLIHGGLLAREGIDDAAMREHDIAPIDLLAVNLYPFAATIRRPDATFEDAIENIDIGGPAMLRAAAKNHERVTVVVDPRDYRAVIEEIERTGEVALTTRRSLAAKVYAYTAAYDARIADYLGAAAPGTTQGFPDPLPLNFHKRADLRYGENPHQAAAFYVATDGSGASIANATQLQGRELSFNNIADADTALECVRQFDVPACVIVKHANPCGAAIAANALEAYEGAYRTDPTSAFGGIIALNSPLDAALATVILERQFVEVLVAPRVGADAKEVLARKPNVRVLATGKLDPSNTRYDFRGVNGGLLVQTRDLGRIRREDLRVVSDRAPSTRELDDLLFAWDVCRFVKSNAIVYVRDGATIGIGAGQMSRVMSSRIAAIKANEENLEVAGSVMASDAFLPFRDGLDVAAGFGIRAVIQPGGSKRDAEVIAAANGHGIAMVFTGMRHFRH